MSLLPRNEYRCPVNRFADPKVSATAADIEHLPGYVGIAGAGNLFQQVDGSHDLPALAVAALGHVFLDPRLLDWMQLSAGRGQAFYGGNPPPGHRGHFGGTGLSCAAIDVNGTGAATADAAAEFGALELEVVAKNP
jgi:hypothetical protein